MATADRMDTIAAPGDPAPLLPPGRTRVFLPAWLGRLLTSRLLLLAVVAAVLLWPGIAGLPPLDRDEARFAQATAQMLESGNFVDIRFQDAPYYQQPAGIYWLQAAAVAVLGPPPQRDIRANRVPGALAAVAAVVLTGHLAGLLYSPNAGFVAGLLLAVSLLLGAEARIATIDAPLLAVILVAQTALLETWRRRDLPPTREATWFSPGIFWLANGVGLMLKGPVILLVTFGTLFGLAVAERQWRWMGRLRPRLGIVLMLAVALPWLVEIGKLSGGAFLSQALGGNLLDKLWHGQQGHGFSPGAYLLLFVLAFWPGSLFAARTLPWVWATRHSQATKFLLAWIVPSWIVFEAAATKLPSYVLPTYPAIAALMAAAICTPGGWTRPNQVGRVLSRVYDSLWLWVGLAFAAAGPVLLVWLTHRLVVPTVLAALVAGLLMVHARRQTRQGAPRGAVACAAAAAAVLSLSAAWLVLPALQPTWLSPRIAAAVRELRPCPDSVLASSSYAEPSLVYLVGRTTRLIPPPAAAEFLHDQPACGLALIGAGDAAAFLDRARTLGLAPRPLTRIEGINAATGHRLELTLYAAK